MAVNEQRRRNKTDWSAITAVFLYWPTFGCIVATRLKRLREGPQKYVKISI